MYRYMTRKEAIALLERAEIQRRVDAIIRAQMEQEGWQPSETEIQRLLDESRNPQNRVMPC